MSAKVVCTIGVFDMLHVGHLDFLKLAASMGDMLVVGIPSDALVERLKGHAPVIPAEHRADMLLALECVDSVDVLETDDYAAWVERLGPDVLALSFEHTAERFVKAARAVEESGGKVARLMRSPRASTTDIVRRIKERE
jgi:D-beta-D-heptose 7-phosphate kinase/D-beta-D-heptose 1-phosphate adenosyltransferase